MRNVLSLYFLPLVFKGMFLFPMTRVFQTGRGQLPRSVSSSARIPIIRGVPASKMSPSIPSIRYSSNQSSNYERSTKWNPYYESGYTSKRGYYANIVDDIRSDTTRGYLELYRLKQLDELLKAKGLTPWFMRRDLINAMNQIDAHLINTFDALYGLAMNPQAEFQYTVSLMNQLYDAGARFSKVAKIDFRKRIDHEIPIELAHLEQHFFDIPLGVLQDNAIMINSFLHCGIFHDKKNIINVEKIKKFSHVILDDELSKKTIRELYTMPNHEREALLKRDSHFQNWWIGEKTVSWWFGTSVSMGLLDVACFLNIDYSKQYYASSGKEQTQKEYAQGQKERAQQEEREKRRRKEEEQRENERAQKERGRAQQDQRRREGHAHEESTESKLTARENLKNYLGLTKPNVSAIDIKKAFYKYSITHHPDKVKLTSKQLADYKKITNWFNEIKADLEKEISEERRKKKTAK